MSSLRIISTRIAAVVLFCSYAPDCLGQTIVSGPIGQSDVTPPQLVNLTISPSPVDTTAGSQTVTFTIQATDDLSGLYYGSVFLQSPALPGVSRQFQYVFVFPSVTGGLSGTMTGTLLWPQNTQPGLWVVTSIFLRDLAGNTNDLAAFLDQQAFPYGLTVISSVVDSKPPVLNSLTFNPSTVDVSAGPQDVTVTLGIADDLSGADFTQDCAPFRVSIRGLPRPIPFGFLFQSQPVFCDPNFMRVSGTPLNGTWQTTITIPRYSEAGTWTPSLNLRDSAGNPNFSSLAAFPTLTVTSSQSDEDPPVLTSLSFPEFGPGVTPFIDTTVQPQTVNVDIGFSDNLSGLIQYPGSPDYFIGQVCFASPSRQQRNCGSYSPLQSGTPLNGHLLPQVFFPRYSEAGTWVLDSVTFFDADTNYVSYSPSDLANLSLPNQLIVGQTSEQPDNAGQVPPFDASGGTVMDRVYGSRAQITAPAGVLSGPATVFIDVLSNPPPVNIPQGYSAAGTLFVDFNLVDDRSGIPLHSFPSPGLSITIPLPSSNTPGTSLALYRLQGGALVPESSVQGGFVTGTVNADGLTASFFNLGTLSTVVGLVPAGIAGDANGDGKVDCADVAIVRAAFGKRAGDSGFDPRADINGDGVVDILDLAFVLRQLPAGTICR